MQERKCKYCGNTFNVESAYSNKKFCSFVCRFKSFLPEHFDKNECFNWPKSINVQTGYGQINIASDLHAKIRSTHRLSYLIFNGQVAENEVVRHTCDNRACVNPHHLVKGSQKDNILDMWARNRQQDYSNCLKGDENPSRSRPDCVPKGESHGQSKLKPEEILCIRASNESHASLGRKYKVKPETISAARAGKTWKHLLA